MVEEHKRQAANTLLVILACSSVKMMFFIALVSWKCMDTAATWNILNLSLTFSTSCNDWVHEEPLNTLLLEVISTPIPGTVHAVNTNMISFQASRALGTGF